MVFASPDIDIDVFTSSIERLGPLARKITMITATNDRALALSRKLAGGITRVGAAEKAQLERLGLNVIDASDHWGIINHDLFLTNAEVRKVIRRAIDERRPQARARLNGRGQRAAYGDGQLLHRARALGRARAPVAEIVIAIDRDEALAGLVIVGRRVPNGARP